MANPPSPSQRRYRGRIRADMRSCQRHLLALQNWNNRYKLNPLTKYPTQLAPPAETVTVDVCLTQISLWLADTGPIAERT